MRVLTKIVITMVSVFTSYSAIAGSTPDQKMNVPLKNETDLAQIAKDYCIMTSRPVQLRDAFPNDFKPNYTLIAACEFSNSEYLSGYIVTRFEENCGKIATLGTTELKFHSSLVSKSIIVGCFIPDNN